MATYTVQSGLPEKLSQVPEGKQVMITVVDERSRQLTVWFTRYGRMESIPKKTGAGRVVRVQGIAVTHRKRAKGTLTYYTNYETYILSADFT
jgi:hypothetical protein